MLSVLIRIAAILMSIHNIQFCDEIRKFPEIFVLLSYVKNFVGTQKRVWISHGKQAIGLFVCVEVLRPSQPNGVM